MRYASSLPCSQNASTSQKDNRLAQYQPVPQCANCLHVLEDSLLELAVTLDLLARVVGGGLAVEREEVAEVELGCLEELDLADVDLEWMLVYALNAKLFLIVCFHVRSGVGKCPGCSSQSHGR